MTNTINANHEITVRAEPSRVYAAWTTHEGLVAWWTKSARIADAPGGVHVFEFDGGNVRFHFRIDELESGKRVRWTGVRGDGMPAEWIGTTIAVDLEKLADGRTRMRMTHGNWPSADGAYAMCNTTWGELVYRLRDWCEGHGRGPLF